MKTYVTPSTEIVVINVADVITASIIDDTAPDIFVD